MVEDDSHEQIDDMIGTAVIDLRRLTEGKMIHDRFIIKDTIDNQENGTVEVRLTIQEIDVS